MPRCYRFAGSVGMDLCPASVLEAEESRGMELRRRREPMAVTTRIRMVGQPPGGLLPLSLFDHVSLADRMALHPRSMETVAPDLVGLYVDYMTGIAMDASKRVAFRIPLLGARLVNRTGEAEALLERIVDFAAPSAWAARLLLDLDAAARCGPQYWKPRRMVPDDATYFNLTRMVARSQTIPLPVNSVRLWNVDYETGFGTLFAGVSRTVSKVRPPSRKPPFSGRPVGDMNPVGNMARARLLAGTAMLRSFRSGRAGMNPARMMVGG